MIQYSKKITTINEADWNNVTYNLDHPELYDNANKLQKSFAYDFYVHHVNMLDNTNMEQIMFLYSIKPFKTPFYDPVKQQYLDKFNLWSAIKLGLYIDWKNICIIAGAIFSVILYIFWGLISCFTMATVVAAFWYFVDKPYHAMSQLRYKYGRKSWARVHALLNAKNVEMKTAARIQFIVVGDYVLINDDKIKWIGTITLSEVQRFDEKPRECCISALKYLIDHKHAIARGAPTEDQKGRDLNGEYSKVDLRDPNYINTNMLYKDLTYGIVYNREHAEQMIIIKEVAEYCATIVNKCPNEGKLFDSAMAMSQKMNIVPCIELNNIIRNTVAVVWAEHSGDYYSYVRNEVTVEGNHNRKISQRNLQLYYAKHIFNSYDMNNARWSLIIANVFSFLSMTAMNLGKKDF
jgi:hypothetical protein